MYCDNNPIIRVDHGGEFWVQLGATIVGGLFSAGMEIGSQLASGKKLSEVNWNSVAIEGVSGAATGLLMSVGLPPSTVLSGRATINAVTSIAHSINEGDGLTNTILKASSSATLTMVVGKSKPIGNRITKGRSGKVNNLINRLTYEPKHLKKNPITESIKNRLTRGVGRTLLKYMYHTYIR